MLSGEQCFAQWYMLCVWYFEVGQATPFGFAKRIRMPPGISVASTCHVQTQLAAAFHRIHSEDGPIVCQP